MIGIVNRRNIMDGGSIADNVNATDDNNSGAGIYAKNRTVTDNGTQNKRSCAAIVTPSRSQAGT